MNCADIRELLSEYIDGELNQAEAKEIEKHLALCGECRHEYDGLSRVASLLRGLPEIPVPDTFDADLRQLLREEKIKKISSMKIKLRTLSGIAAVFVVGIFSLTMYNQNDMPAPADRGADLMVATDALAENNTLRTETTGQDAGLSDPPAGEAAETAAGAAQYSLDSRLYGIHEQAGLNDFAELIEDEDSAFRPEMPLAVSRWTILDDTAKTEIEQYLSLLDEMLKDLNFSVIEYFKDESGIWNIEVNIYALDEMREVYVEKYTYLGQDGKLWREDLSSSTETAY